MRFTENISFRHVFSSRAKIKNPHYAMQWGKSYAERTGLEPERCTSYPLIINYLQFKIVTCFTFFREFRHAISSRVKIKETNNVRPRFILGNECGSGDSLRSVGVGAVSLMINKDAKELQLPTAFGLVGVPRKNPLNITPSDSGTDSTHWQGLVKTCVALPKPGIVREFRKNLSPLFFKNNGNQSRRKWLYP